MTTEVTLDRPAALISSSSDLSTVRTALKNRLEAEMRARGHVIEAFMFEEHETAGEFADARSPIQRQIEDILQGRLMLTTVMFGEKVGLPLQGESASEAVLADWGPDGLTHPWPDERDDQDALLRKSCFPLTGTTYELLAALSGDEDIIGRCIVGYVANVQIGPDRELTDDIAFNGGLWLHNAVPIREGNMEDVARRDAFVRDEYAPQRHGLFNLLRALARRGKAIQRFRTQEEMVDQLLLDAVRAMMRQLPDQSGQLPFKRIMEVYDHGDPLPLPDRLELRGRLRTELTTCGEKGEMLVLEGPSGCGKSSLLRKGLLDDLPFDMLGAHVVLFRPNELLERDERTPFLKMYGKISEVLSRAGCGDFTRLGAGGGGDPKAAAIAVAEQVEEGLTSHNARLLVAIDQFEDVMDHAELEEGAIDKPRSWWQVIRLLDALANRQNIWVAGTLESQRQSLVEKLSLRQRTGLSLRPVNVDFPVGRVSDFVRMTAANAGLPISDELAIKIQGMVENFERNRRHSEETPTNASFLPLLGLWLARLFEVFQDRSGDTGRSASRAMRDTTDAITEHDLSERGITLQFDGLIAELMDAAFEEADRTEQEVVGRRLAITDLETLNAFLNSDQLPDELKLLIDSHRKEDGSVNHQSFFRQIGNEVIKLPGIGYQEVYKSVPDNTVLRNLLSMLVGIDRAGNPRLMTGSVASPIEGQAAILAVLRRRRLLVPAGPGRVQLVHQAVIDNWKHGRRWFDENRPILQVRRRMQARYEEARDMADLKKPDNTLQPLNPTTEMITDAARLLKHNSVIWPNHFASPLDEYDVALRDFCLETIEAAEDGAFSVTFRERGFNLIHVASSYDRIDAIERWIRKDGSLLGLRTVPHGNTPLIDAAWSAPSAVATLLREGADPKDPDADGWHPIAASFQHNDTLVFDSLIGHYTDATEVVGPGGQTLLSLAAWALKPTFLKRLIDKAADIDFPNAYGFTPLALAAKRGRISQITILMEHGANPLAIDGNQWTALHNAVVTDHAKAIATILNHGELTFEDRNKLLTHEGLEGVISATPLALATYLAKPSALAVLLEHCDPADPSHRFDDRHPIAQMTWTNKHSEGGEPLADRVSMCARLLLENGGFEVADLVEARRGASDFPDARRLIDEYLARTGALDEIPDEDLQAFLISRRAPLAISVMRRSPHLLDHVVEGERRLADLMIDRAHPETLLAALAEGHAPIRDPELFRLGAGLRLLKEGRNLPVETDESLHPMLRALASGELIEGRERLFEISLSGDLIRPLPHRIALHGLAEIYRHLVAGLKETVPKDEYGRPPSALAPIASREQFEAVEAAARGELQ